MVRHDNTRHFILGVTPSLLPLGHTVAGSYQQKNTGKQREEMGKHDKTKQTTKRKNEKMLPGWPATTS